jgi:hypothetical protein
MSPSMVEDDKAEPKSQEVQRLEIVLMIVLLLEFLDKVEMVACNIVSTK